MKTLKRTLALVLVLAMSVALFAISASAAEFKDAEQIEYKQAVDTLTGLGIIEGFDDGTFQPTGGVTRAQMAKLVSYALLGAKEAAKLSANADVFTDVAADFWGAGYILFCKNMGIIVGYGDGTFGPNDNVTGYQVAKMLLCALGYGQNEEYEGANWSSNVSRKALDLDLFKGNLAGLNDQPANREESCLYLWNALNTDIVTYDGDGYQKVNLGTILAPVYETLGHKNYNITTAIGILTANGATASRYQADAKKEKAAQSVIGAVTYDVETGLDLFGHTVKVYYETGKTDHVFSIEDKTQVVATVNIGKVGDDNNARVDQLRDAGFKVGADDKNADIAVRVSDNYADFAAGTTTLAAMTQKDTYIFLSDNTVDPDSKAPARAIKLSEAIYKVDKLNDATSVLTLKDANNGTVTVDYDDVVTGLDSIAKDDYVIGTKVNNTFWSFKLAEIKTGAVTKVDGNKVTVGGTQYDVFSGTAATAALNSKVVLPAAITKKDIEDEKSFSVYLDSVGNYMMLIKNSDDDSSSLVIAYDGFQKLAADGDYYSTNSYVKALSLDGTTTTYMTKKNQAAPDYSNYTDGNLSAMAVSVNSKDIATFTDFATGKLTVDGTDYFKANGLAAALKVKTDTVSIAVGSADAGFNAAAKAYINSETKFVFVQYDNTDEEWVIKVLTGPQNTTLPVGTTIIAKKSGSNYIANIILVNAKFTDDGAKASNVLYFDEADYAAGTATGTGNAGFTAYYNFEGYDTATGSKVTIAVKSLKELVAGVLTEQTISAATRLSGFYSYSVVDGLYNLSAYEVDANHAIADDALYISDIGDYITVSGGYADYDFSDAKVIDGRADKEKKDGDGFYKATISSVSDMKAAKDAGYNVYLDLLLNTDKTKVEAVVVVNVESTIARLYPDDNAAAKVASVDESAKTYTQGTGWDGTVTGLKLSGGATATIAGTTITVTAKDGVTSQAYTLA